MSPTHPARSRCGDFGTLDFKSGLGVCGLGLGDLEASVLGELRKDRCFGLRVNDPYDAL